MVMVKAIAIILVAIITVAATAISGMIVIAVVIAITSNTCNDRGNIVTIVLMGVMRRGNSSDSSKEQ